jgi:hypothetical protein
VAKEVTLNLFQVLPDLKNTKDRKEALVVSTKMVTVTTATTLIGIKKPLNVIQNGLTQHLSKLNILEMMPVLGKIVAMSDKETVIKTGTAKLVLNVAKEAISRSFLVLPDMKNTKVKREA